MKWTASGGVLDTWHRPTAPRVVAGAFAATDGLTKLDLLSRAHRHVGGRQPLLTTALTAGRWYFRGGVGPSTRHSNGLVAEPRRRHGVPLVARAVAAPASCAGQIPGYRKSMNAGLAKRTTLAVLAGTDLGYFLEYAARS